MKTLILSLLIVLALVGLWLGTCADDTEELLPGWKGEIPRGRPRKLRAGRGGNSGEEAPRRAGRAAGSRRQDLGGFAGLVDGLNSDGVGGGGQAPDLDGAAPRRQAFAAESDIDLPRRYVQQLSATPRAYLFHNFLTTEETDYLVSVAEPYVQRSQVVTADGKGAVDNIRTSYGVFIPRNLDEMIAHIEAKLANWTMLPANHGEDLQILRYQNGQKYGDHMDVLTATEQDGNRIATVLMYLSDPEFGGETCFHSGKYLPGIVPPTNLSACGNRGVCVVPKKGNALLFFDLTLDGRPDPYSTHTGCPVLSGTKWSATKWIHTKPFRPDEFAKKKPGTCADWNDSCPSWAAQGECEKNEGFMVGTALNPGSCRLSCKKCVPCAEGDVVCMQKNLRG